MSINASAKLKPVFRRVTAAPLRKTGQCRYDSSQAPLSKSLPVSPLLDSTALEARERWREPKERPSTKTQTEFQAKLAENPYALASPVRMDDYFRYRLPKFFLQDFHFVTHPETNAIWAAPDEPLGWLPPRKKGDPMPKDSLKASREMRPARMLSSHKLIEEISETVSKAKDIHDQRLNQGLRPLLMAMQDALGTKRQTFPVWREDMDTFLLSHLRQRVFEEFEPLMNSENKEKFLVPIKSRDQLDSEHGSILYLSRPGQRSDVMMEDGTIPKLWRNDSLRQSVPVYDLASLLGEDLAEKLRTSFDVGTTTFAVRMRLRTRKLQLALWKIQLYCL